MEQYLGTDELPKNDLITYLQKNADAAFLRHWKLTGTNKSIRKNRNCSQLIAAYKVYIGIKTLFCLGMALLCLQLFKYSYRRAVRWDILKNEVELTLLICQC